MHTRTMQRDFGGSARAGALFSAIPQTAHSALTPLGEIEQAGKLADGLRRPRDGWRHVVFRAGLIFLGALVVGLVVVAALASLGQ